jgi:hypothetical protein
LFAGADWGKRPGTLAVKEAALGKVMDSIEIFHKAYTLGRWSNLGSGPGSTVSFAASTICRLVAFFEKYKIGLLIDAPCGDQQWAPILRRAIPSLKYIGIDIAPPVIYRNKEVFENTTLGVEFFLLDLTEPNLFGILKQHSKTYQDFIRSNSSNRRIAILSRHVLEHNDFAHGKKILENNDSSGADFFFGTWQPWKNGPNEDVPQGVSYRTLDLTRPPYNMPNPSIAWIENEHNKGDWPYVAVWKLPGLASNFDKKIKKLRKE